MKSILVTGGAGFIGSHLCEKLLINSKVKKVVCIDNLDSVYSVALKRKNIALLKGNKRFKFYKADIRNKAVLNQIFKKEKFSHVVHLAAKTDTRISVHEPKEYIDVNILGTLNLLELAKDYKLKGFIFVSSSSIYGNSKTKLPFRETEITDFPLSPYAATKKAGEILAHTYFFNHALPVTVFRFFNVYGERMRPGLVLSQWVENISYGRAIEMSGTGKRKRDFTYINDVVDALILALKKGKNFEIYNIASSSPASLTELLSIVEKVMKTKAIVKRRESNKSSIDISHADIRKATKTLGWRPKVSLEKGVSNYVKWFKNDRFKDVH